MSSLAPNRVRDVIDRLVREGTVESRADGSEHLLFPVSIPPAVGDVLGAWIGRENARRTIEVGLAHGISALYICEALVASGDPDVRHVAIDPYQHNAPDGRGFSGVGLQSLDEGGLTAIVEFFEDESQFVLPSLLADGRSFDLAFVDGNHRFDRVFVDLFYLGRLVRPGGIIILDDYELPGIARAVSFFLTNVGWTLEEASDGDPLHGWAVLRTANTEDRRHLSYFVEF